MIVLGQLLGYFYNQNRKKNFVILMMMILKLWLLVLRRERIIWWGEIEDKKSMIMVNWVVFIVMLMIIIIWINEVQLLLNYLKQVDFLNNDWLLSWSIVIVLFIIIMLLKCYKYSSYWLCYNSYIIKSINQLILFVVILKFKNFNFLNSKKNLKCLGLGDLMMLRQYMVHCLFNS